MCNTRMRFYQFKDFINDNTTGYRFILYDNTSQSQNENERLKVAKEVLYDDMKVDIEKGKRR